MTVEEYIQVLDNSIETLENKMFDVAEEIATGGLALVVNRIQSEGLPGRSYSTNKLPAFFAKGRENNAGGRAVLETKKVKAEGISYKEWREANGLQTSFVDLTFTGRMFQGLTVIEVTNKDGNYVAVVGGFDKEVNDKLRWNAIRFGQFLELNDEESAILTDIFNERVLEILKSTNLI